MTVRQGFSKAKAFFAMEKETAGRLLAIFLFALFWVSLLMPSGLALAQVEVERRQTLAAAASHDIAEQHIKPPKEGSTDTKTDSFASPSPIAEQKSKYTPAADYAPSDSPIPGLPPLVKQPVGRNGQTLQQPNTTKPNAEEQEVIAKRTANTRTFRNRNGSRRKNHRFSSFKK